MQYPRHAYWVTSSCYIAERLYHDPRRKRTAVEIMYGFSRALHETEPSRLYTLLRAVNSRILAVGENADCEMVNLCLFLQSVGAVDKAFAVLNTNYPQQSRTASSSVRVPCGGDGRQDAKRAPKMVVGSDETKIPPMGIEFRLPAELAKVTPKPLLNALIRMHINTGHPPNSELERIIRLADGSKIAQEACRGLHCSICKKAAPPKTPRPGKIRSNVGEFNSALLGDLCYNDDPDGKTHGWLILIDEGTDWAVAKYIGYRAGNKHKTASQLYDYVEQYWINWAGPPHVFIADNERGFGSQEFARTGQSWRLVTSS